MAAHLGESPDNFLAFALIDQVRRPRVGTS
jgi:hypothetical protein